MASTIQVKRTRSSALPASLSFGELLFHEGASALYIGKYDGSLLQLTDPGGSYAGRGANSDITSLSGLTGPITQTLGVLSASTPALASTASWDSAGTAFYHWFADITNTASAAASRPAELRVDGTSVFSVDPLGQLRLGPNALPIRQSTVQPFALEFPNAVVFSNSSAFGTTYDGAVRVKIAGLGTASDTHSLIAVNSSGVPALLVRDDLRVGIGTSSPRSAFDVRGSVTLGTPSSLHGVINSTDGLYINTDYAGVGGAVDGRIVIGNGRAYDTGGSVWACFDKSGKIGIANGIGTPDAQLHVNTVSATTKGLIVRGFTDQAESLLELQSQAGTRLIWASALGRLKIGSPTAGIYDAALEATAPDSTTASFAAYDSSGAMNMFIFNGTVTVQSGFTTVGDMVLRQGGTGSNSYVDFYNAVNFRDRGNSFAVVARVLPTGFAGNGAGLTGVTAAALAGAAFPRVFSFMLAQGAAATLGTNKTNEVVVERAGVITKAYIHAKAAPAGSALIVDINLNGTSIWDSTQANRLQLAADAIDGTQVAFDTVNVAEGDVLSIDIDQVGSASPGQDISVQLLALIQNS